MNALIGQLAGPGPSEDSSEDSAALRTRCTRLNMPPALGRHHDRHCQPLRAASMASGSAGWRHRRACGAGPAVP
eukprot:366426-Chlamydomonas_euryale.AAC.19